MMPIRFIRQKLVQEAEVIDLEAVGARLEHHGVKISVANTFISDTGDRWECKLWHEKYDKYQDIGRREPMVRMTEPSLRTAIIKALKAAEEQLGA